jgi:hypothetical protein
MNIENSIEHNPSVETVENSIETIDTVRTLNPNSPPPILYPIPIVEETK